MGSNIKFVFKRGRKKHNLIPSHLHDDYELIYYERGSGLSVIDGVDHAYSQGKFCLIPPRTQHLERAYDETVVICVAFSAAHEGDEFYADMFGDPKGEIYQIADSIVSEMQSRRPMSSEIANGYLSVLLMKLRRHIFEGHGVQPEKNISLYSAYNYICAYYNTDIDFSELAASIGYSYDRFRHIFPEQFQITPKQLLLKKRVEAAKQMLGESDEKIQSIAYRCGFKTASQFTVIFKQSEGIPPASYRKNLQKS